MTFMFGFFTLQVPAGLTLYWVTSNLLQMLQQWVVTSERFHLSGTGRVEAKLANSTIGAEVVDGMVQKLMRPSARTYTGRGKTQEMRIQVAMAHLPEMQRDLRAVKKKLDL